MLQLCLSSRWLIQLRARSLAHSRFDMRKTAKKNYVHIYESTKRIGHSTLPMVKQIKTMIFFPSIYNLNLFHGDRQLSHDDKKKTNCWNGKSFWEKWKWILTPWFRLNNWPLSFGYLWIKMQQKKKLLAKQGERARKPSNTRFHWTCTRTQKRKRRRNDRKVSFVH